jgi:hypothetical protein
MLYILGGFTSFKADYPNLCEAEESEQSGPSYIRLSDLRISNDDASPLKTCAPSSPFNESKVRKGAVEILPNLYLGNARDASDLRELLDRNITYILNVTNDIPNKFENDPRFTYMNLRVQDNWQTNLADHFQEAFKFIGEYLRRCSTVLNIESLRIAIGVFFRIEKPFESKLEQTEIFFKNILSIRIPIGTFGDVLWNYTRRSDCN